MYYSFIVPTYKRYSDVIELLMSLVNQEFKNFEVIICDNSPDDSIESHDSVLSE